MDPNATFKNQEQRNKHSDNDNSAMKPQKILSLKVSNIKRIRIAHIEPNGRNVVLTGPNDAGKSTAMDALSYAFEGGKALPELLLRKGTKKGGIDVEMEDLMIRLGVTEKGTTLSVKRKPGMEKVTKPQSILNEFFSVLTFDPIKFDKMGDAEQVETVRKLAGIDLSQIDIEIRKLEATRLDIGRTGKLIQDELKVAKEYEDVPENQVVMSELTEKLAAENLKVQARTNQNNKVTKIRETYEEQVRLHDQKLIDIQNKESLLGQLKEDAKNIKSNMDHCVKEGKAEKVAFDEMPVGTPDDVAKEINEADETNRKVRHNLSLIGKRDDYARRIEEYQTADNDLKLKREEKTGILSQSKLPITGLEFSDAGVTMDGVPFSQVGVATRLKLSTQMGIAMNPTLKVMLVRDASLMDEKTLAELMSIANAADIQVWLEQVDEKAPDGADIVVFEDGAVKFQGKDNKAVTVDPSPNAAKFTEDEQADVRESFPSTEKVQAAVGKIVAEDKKEDEAAVDPTKRLTMEELQDKIVAEDKREDEAAVDPTKRLTMEELQEEAAKMKKMAEESPSADPFFGGGEPDGESPEEKEEF